MPPAFSTIVVVPVRMRFERGDRHHQGLLVALEQAGGPDGQARGIGESEVLVEAALEDRGHVRVAVDQARQQRLAAAVVDLGVRILPEDLSVGPIAAILSPNRERHIVVHRIGVDDRRVGEDDGPAAAGCAVAPPCARSIAAEPAPAAASSSRRLSLVEFAMACAPVMFWKSGG